jgi:hypothetical protein
MKPIIPTKLQPNLANLSEKLWLPFYMRQNAMLLTSQMSELVNKSNVRNGVGGIKLSNHARLGGFNHGTRS